MSAEIRIYVADLAAYNSGKLHGTWIDATSEVEDIQEEIYVMLANSPEELAEEYAIHDHEGFEGYSLSEYEGIERVHQIACFLEEYPDIGGALLNHCSGDIDEARKVVEEYYCGCYSSLADYAQELTEETTTIPEHLAIYIDYESMSRDMAMSGNIFSITTAIDEVHVFWNY